MDKLSKRNQSKASQMPKKRGDSHLSAARIVRPHALTEPASSLRTSSGARSKPGEQNGHRQTPCRHYDTFAGKSTLPNVTQINHQKPAIQPVAGKTKRRPALALHDFFFQIICSRLLPKNPACGLTARVTRLGWERGFARETGFCRS